MPQTVNNKVTVGMSQVLDKHRDEVLRKATLVGVEYLAKHKEFDDPSDINDATALKV